VKGAYGKESSLHETERCDPTPNQLARQVISVGNLFPGRELKCVSSIEEDMGLWEAFSFKDPISAFEQRDDCLYTG